MALSSTPNILIPGAVALVGGELEVPIEVRNAAGVLIDPGTLAVQVTAASTTTYTYTVDSELVRESTGNYLLTIITATDDRHKFVALADGKVAGSGYVHPKKP